MKLKYPIILLLVSVIVILLGALFKVQSWVYASELLTLATAIQVVAIVWIIIKIILNKDPKSILNR